MIAVQNVSKVYRLYRRPVDRIIEMLLMHRAKRYREFWALRDINLTVERGEVLAIVGPNGSGKSTLLQVISGLVTPTTGRVVTQGRVAALLELGAGFNPEFTGRENVYLNSEILGLTRDETDRIFPAICTFAEIGEFLDRPVKEYSSGMYIRLAFATAIHVDPEVLIVDEALAVGDAVFASRCMRKLEELQAKGITILFVSHDLGIVKRLATRAVFLLHGRMIAEGSPSDVVNRYVAYVHDQQGIAAAAAATNGNSGSSAAQLRGAAFRHGDGASIINSVEILDGSAQPVTTLDAGAACTIRVHATFQQASADPIVGILLRDRLGMDVFGTNTRVERIDLGEFQPGDELTVDFAVECLLTAQDYTLTVATQHSDGKSQDWRDDILTLTITDDKPIAGLARLPVRVKWERHCPDHVR